MKIKIIKLFRKYNFLLIFNLKNLVNKLLNFPSLINEKLKKNKNNKTK